MSKYAKLKPDSLEWAKFWESKKDEVREELEEINNDVFDGKGTFGEPIYKGFYTTSNPPNVGKHYLCLNTERGFICVFVASSGKLMVVVERQGSTNSWKSWPLLSRMETFLTLAVEHLLS